MFLDEHAVEGAARFGVSPEKLTFIGGFQNFIYSYNRDEIKYILRFTPSTLRTSEGLAAELEWIRYLSGNGLSVSDPVFSVDRKDFERIQGNIMDFYVTSFKHAPGRKIGYPECLGNSILYEQCGRMTGRLHELAKRYKSTAKGTHGSVMNTSCGPRIIYLQSINQFFLPLMNSKHIWLVYLLLLIISV